eukprot:TRINITY_DN39314_c0_g1_i2.p1 TRINITY_DN39314_c0_g1~~TRINITY_DN39314_c0_g1_i2.p1  ORF type:complete len:130 (+),score=24.56 TRINITY_DN39314_c0_g1_i2:105-494(+)
MFAKGLQAVTGAASSAAGTAKAGAQVALSGGQAALSSGKSKLLEAKDYASSGSYMQVGTALSGYVKEKVDLNTLQNAGFGAVGETLHKRRMEARGALFDLSKPVRARMIFGLTLDPTKQNSSSLKHVLC